MRTATNVLGVKGVTEKYYKRYVAQITYNYKNYYIGIFDTVEAAKQAYDEVAKNLFGEFGGN